MMTSRMLGRSPARADVISYLPEGNWPKIVCGAGEHKPYHRDQSFRACAHSTGQSSRARIAYVTAPNPIQTVTWSGTLRGSSRSITPIPAAQIADRTAPDRSPEAPAHPARAEKSASDTANPAAHDAVKASANPNCLKVPTRTIPTRTLVIN